MTGAEYEVEMKVSPGRIVFGQTLVHNRNPRKVYRIENIKTE